MDVFGAISVYPTPESLQSKIDEYFDYCFVIENKFGRQIPKCIVPPTFSGLARYLGFSSRKALINYTASKGNEMYEDAINDAKLRIEDFCEQKLIMSKGPSTGIQFSLKNNCGWEETSKQQLTGENGAPVVFSWGVDDKQLEKAPVESVATIVETLPAPTVKQEEVTQEEKTAETEKRFDQESDEPQGETDEPQDLGFEVEF